MYKKTVKELIQDWIIKEIDSLTKEYTELIQCKSDIHPNPCAISNSMRLHRSNMCNAKIDAYIKLLDYIKELKDASSV